MTAPYQVPRWFERLQAINNLEDFKPRYYFALFCTGLALLMGGLMWADTGAWGITMLAILGGVLLGAVMASVFSTVRWLLLRWRRQTLRQAVIHQPPVPVQRWTARDRQRLEKERQTRQDRQIARRPSAPALDELSSFQANNQPSKAPVPMAATMPTPTSPTSIQPSASSVNTASPLLSAAVSAATGSTLLGWMVGGSLGASWLGSAWADHRAAESESTHRATLQNAQDEADRALWRETETRSQAEQRSREPDDDNDDD